MPYFTPFGVWWCKPTQVECIIAVVHNCCSAFKTQKFDYANEDIVSSCTPTVNFSTPLNKNKVFYIHLCVRFPAQISN